MTMLRFALVIFSASAVVAGESSRSRTLNVSLDEAVALALKKNFTVESARLDPKAAKERVTQAKGRFDPVFDFGYTRGEATTRDQFRRDTTGKGGHFEFNSISQSATWSTGVSGVTAWGLGYDVGASTRSTSGTHNSFDQDFDSELSFSLRQPLLRGAGTEVNLAGIRIARNNVHASEWGVKQRIMEVVTDVIETYNDLHFAHENLEVARRNKALAGQLLRDNIKRVEIGVKTPLDVTTAQAEVASREESVITAMRAVKDQENFLKQLITRDMIPMLGTRLEISPPGSPSFTANVVAGIERALELRPDYRQAKLELENRRITLVLEKNSKLPRLDLSASLSVNGFDDDFGTSAQRSLSRDQTNWTTGATFSVPIGNREAKGRVNAAQIDIAQSLVNLQRLEQNIVVLVDNASGAVTTARQRIEATTEANKLAKESLIAGEARLVAGTGTTFEVLELQRKVSEAETSELRARADYNKAIARFNLQTGATLRIHGIKVD
jgi:outer membrane protein TolC